MFLCWVNILFSKQNTLSMEGNDEMYSFYSGSNSRWYLYKNIFIYYSLISKDINGKQVYHISAKISEHFGNKKWKELTKNNWTWKAAITNKNKTYFPDSKLKLNHCKGGLACENDQCQFKLSTQFPNHFRFTDNICDVRCKHTAIFLIVI